MSVPLCDQLFLSYRHFLRKLHCLETKLTSNNTWWKIPNICVSGVRESKISTWVALLLIIFELQAVFEISVPNGPKWPWSLKGQSTPTYIHAHYLHVLRRPTFFLRFCLWLIISKIFSFFIFPLLFYIFKFQNSKKYLLWVRSHGTISLVEKIKIVEGVEC